MILIIIIIISSSSSSSSGSGSSCSSSKHNYLKTVPQTMVLSYCKTCIRSLLSQAGL